MTLKIIPLLSLLLLSIVSLQAQTEKQNSTVPATTIIKVMDITLHDSAIYKQYQQNIEPIVKKYSGKYLVRLGGMAFD